MIWKKSKHQPGNDEALNNSVANQGAGPKSADFANLVSR